LYVGPSAPSNGASSLIVDFGALPVGSPSPPAQSVVLNKSGAAPTYFEINVAGEATCAPGGRDWAFDYNGGTRSLLVGLPAGITATAGPKSGTIVIDNLELTNQGSGTGSVDGNDVITVLVHVGMGCPDPFADADFDGNVDQSDFAALQLCYSGNGSSLAGCACFDWDGSGMVDLLDFAVFQACFTGPGVLVDPSCDD
jgi:hypothetical protein